jgi:hypothetical protein
MWIPNPPRLCRLQACRGQVDSWVAPYMALALGRLARAEKRVLRDALVCVVANALHYNPALALSSLVSAGALPTFFAGWLGMVQAAKPSGKPKHFRRMHDKKVRSTRHAWGARVYWWARHTSSHCSQHCRWCSTSVSNTARNCRCVRWACCPC